MFLAPVSEYALSFFYVYFVAGLFNFSLYAPLLWNVLCYLVWCQFFLQCVVYFVIIRSVCWRCWLPAFVGMCKFCQFCFLSTVGLFLLWILHFLILYLLLWAICTTLQCAFLCVCVWVMGLFSVLFRSARIFSCFLPSGWMYWGWVCLFPLLCDRHLVLGCFFLCWFLDVGSLSFDCFPVPVHIQFPSACSYGHWHVFCSSHISFAYYRNVSDIQWIWCSFCWLLWGIICLSGL